MDKTPLHTAVLHGDAAAVKALVNAGAKVKVRDKYGETPLDIAEMMQTEDTITVLTKAIAKETSITSSVDRAIGYTYEDAHAAKESLEKEIFRARPDITSISTQWVFDDNDQHTGYRICIGINSALTLSDLPTIPPRCRIIRTADKFIEVKIVNEGPIVPLRPIAATTAIKTNLIPSR